MIFGISIALFLIIPYYFNHEKRIKLIENHLSKNYNFELKKYEKIKFKALPIPRLEIHNVQINFETPQIKSTVKNLKIYPKILSIYNYNNFQTNKIILKDSNIILNTSDVRFLISYILNKKEKFILDQLNLAINNEDRSIIKLEKLKFSNFGYNKNLISGYIYEKKFKIKIKKNLKNFNFELSDAGINADINFEENRKNNLIIGAFKSKILDSRLRFNFEYDHKQLNIFNSYFRSKNLSFKNKSLLVLKPYFYTNSKFDIQTFNFEIIENIKFKKVFEKKNILKKINSKNEINFISKKFSNNLIDDLKLKINIAYGRINYLKKFSISDNYFECQGGANFLDEYPLLSFNCSIVLNNKERLLRKFSIKTKSQNKVLKLNSFGNLNILNKKINFKKITVNDDYNASKEDLKYFKESFENIFSEENFIKTFNLKKIRRFIIEVS